jgi:hypothetical protein
MAASLEELERRLAELEQEVKELRAIVRPPIDPTAAERGAAMMRQAKLSAPAMAAAWRRAMQEMGIADVKPVGVEKLREMLIAEGIRPEDNEFSRAIIEERERTRG